MRFIVVDWGTSRFRAYLVEAGTVTERVSSEEGISELRKGQHAAVFQAHCGAWLKAEPDLPVALVGMIGSREGWVEAPYAECPAGAAEIAARLAEVDLGEGRRGHIVPGLRYEAGPGIVDVMRGEETHLLGAGVEDGIVALPGTHCKWVEMQGGRIGRFATYVTGELYGLLREHSMIGRPATDPPDNAGFGLGLAAAERNAGEGHVGLTNLLFGARAAAVTGRLSGAALGPYLSGLLTGDEINGALAQFPVGDKVTVVADGHRAQLYVEALGRRGIAVTIRSQEETLLDGIGRILAARSGQH